MKYLISRDATASEKAFLRKVIKEDKRLEAHRRKLARINRKYSPVIRRKKYQKHRRY